MITIWPEYGSTNFCCADKLEYSDSPTKGHTNNSVPGWFFTGPSEQANPAESSKHSTRRLNEARLGNKSRKVVQNPGESLVYLGVLWNSWGNSKSLPADKVPALVTALERMLLEQRTNLKDLQSFVGVLNFASFVVPRQAKLKLL